MTGPVNKQMPESWNRRWRKLWFSGAINQDRILFARAADRLEAYQKTHTQYFDDDAAKVRAGERLGTFTRGLTDLLASVASELRLSRRPYARCFFKLFGYFPSHNAGPWNNLETKVY